MLIHFTNGLASTKEEATSINLDSLRTVKVYGKLMLNKGVSFEQALKSKSFNSFLLSNDSEFIRAELFVVGKSNQIITDNRLWLNVSKDADIQADSKAKMFWVEIIHPTFDPKQSKPVSFK